MASRCQRNARAGECAELQCALWVILPLHHTQASSPGWTRSCRAVWRPTSRRAPPRRTWARAPWARSAKPAGALCKNAQQAAQQSAGNITRLQVQHKLHRWTLQPSWRSLTCSASALQPQDADLPDPDAQSHVPGLRLQPAACAPLPEGSQRQSHRGDGGQCPAGGVAGKVTRHVTVYKIGDVTCSPAFAVQVFLAAHSAGSCISAHRYGIACPATATAPLPTRCGAPWTRRSACRSATCTATSPMERTTPLVRSVHCWALEPAIASMRVVQTCTSGTAEWLVV